MLRELFDLRCSTDEEGIVAACVMRGIPATELALEPTVALSVMAALTRLGALPMEWCRELASQTLSNDHEGEP